MSARKAFERLSKAGIHLEVRDGSVVAKSETTIGPELMADIERHRHAFRAAAVAADDLIQGARKKEARA